VKKVVVCFNTSDDVQSLVYDKNGILVSYADGYAPGFLPKEAWDVGFHIDIETGKILNWPENALELIKEHIKEEEEDE
jgi:hypothetical protein